MHAMRSIFAGAELQVDGAPGHLDACSGTVLLYTKANKLCLWRIQGDEAIPVAGSGKAVDLPPDLTVISMRCSCDGSKVSCSS